MRHVTIMIIKTVTITAIIIAVIFKNIINFTFFQQDKPELGHVDLVCAAANLR